MRTIWTFHTARQIQFGRGAAARCGEVVGGLGAGRCLIVTDQRLLGAGAVEPVTASLRDAGISATVFEDGEPEPSMALAVRCARAASEASAEAIVGVGGGSNLDLAKITATLLAHGGHPRDFAGDCRIPGPVAPLVCVPTTAGTGSEVSAAAVLLDEERGIKVGVLSNHLRPAAALVDPLLTVSCPPRVTADSGIDALVHAVEALTAVDNSEFPLPEGEQSIYQGRHPLGSLLAEEAIRLVGRHLPRAYGHGDDLDAREGMHLAALLAGLAFSNIGVALVHAMEYAVGAAVHSSHGLGNGLLLPYVMEFNRPHCSAALARIARLLGRDTGTLSLDAAARSAIGAVRDLRRQVDVPDRLREIGVREEQLPAMARTAHGLQRLLRVNPRIPTRQEIEEVFRAAW